MRTFFVIIAMTQNKVCPAKGTPWYYCYGKKHLEVCNIHIFTVKIFQHSNSVFWKEVISNSQRDKRNPLLDVSSTYDVCYSQIVLAVDELLAVLDKDTLGAG